MPLTDAVLGVDSLVAGAAVAPLVGGGSTRLAAAALFGTADAAATFLGTLIAVPLQGLLVVAPLMPVLYGVYLVAVSSLAGHRLRARRLPTLAVLGALAVALSVDNLVSAAAGIDGSVVGMGCTSAVAALLGLTIGSRVFDRLPDRRRGAWVAVGLVAAGCLALVG